MDMGQKMRFGLITAIVLLVIVVSVAAVAWIIPGGGITLMAPSATPTVTYTPLPTATPTPHLSDMPRPSDTPMPSPTITPFIHRATVTDPALLTAVYPRGMTWEPPHIMPNYQMVIDIPKWDYQMGDASLLLGYEAYLDKDHPLMRVEYMLNRWPWMADPGEYNWYVQYYFHGKDDYTDPSLHMFQAWYFTNRWDMQPWIMNIPNADSNQQHPFLEFTLDDGKVINPNTGQKGAHGLRDFWAYGTYPEQSPYYFGDAAAKMKYGLWSFYAVIPMNRKVIKVQVSKWPGGPKYTVYEGHGDTPLAPAK
jgi:hypothetical protein